MSTEKVFQKEGLSLWGLIHVAEAEDLLECAVGQAEENCSRQGIYGTT